MVKALKECKRWECFAVIHTDKARGYDTAIADLKRHGYYYSVMLSLSGIKDVVALFFDRYLTCRLSF